MVVAHTDFIKVLERIHSKTDLRYGQIINDAMQLQYGRSSEQMAKGWFGANYDTYHITDEEFTRMLERFEKRWC